MSDLYIWIFLTAVLSGIILVTVSLLFDLCQYSGLKPLRVFIEGNIGAGKTTIIRRLKEKYPMVYRIFEEPVDVWRKIGISNLYYSNPSRWGYTFQNFAILTRLLRLDKAPKIYRCIDIIERSCIADRHVFMEIMKEDQGLEQTEIDIYDAYADSMIEKYGVFDADQYNMMFILMDSDPETCRKRIQIRDRSEECGIELEYLQKIRDRHNRIIRDMAAISRYDVTIIENSEESSIDEIVDKIHDAIIRRYMAIKK